jgi:transcriptional regulator with XRE-family HTH domain
MILKFPQRFQRHARTSADSDRGGYRSGRNSCLETPDALSTASTRNGGTSSHCETACAEMPSSAANAAKPPAALIARFSASVPSLMARKSSIALVKSQATLHCTAKAKLYDIDMTLGKRIAAARRRLKLVQTDIARHFGITGSAVSAWERDIDKPEHDRLPKLARLLRVPLSWLLEGNGDPPDPDDLEVLLDDLTPDQRRTVRAVIESFLGKRRGQVG